MNDNLFVLGASSLFYFYWIMSLDTLFKSFEITKVISYSTTTFFCIVNEFTEYRYSYVVYMSMLGIYGYEIVYYKPDKSHLLHHIITSAIILSGTHNYANHYPNSLYIDMSTTHTDLIRLANLMALVNVSSIFSALRQVLPCEATKQMYYYIYITSKLGCMVIHYKYIYVHIDIFQNYMPILYLTGLVHLLQLYFCYTIVRIIYKPKTK
jgi:hypothetical protein